MIWAFCTLCARIIQRTHSYYHATTDLPVVVSFKPFQHVNVYEGPLPM